MTEYTHLLSKLKKQEKKIKDLPELISKITFIKNQVSLFKSIVHFLEENEDVSEFEWIYSPNQRKKAKKDSRIIIAQFRYKIENPIRCLTIYRLHE